jgi:carotenoid cleavage dioxygenase
MWTWHIDLAAGRVTESQLDDHAVEFPRIDDRLAGLDARYSVSVGKNGWIRHDLTNGSAVAHDLGHGGPGEAVFVPATGAPDETNGYYLGYVYDRTRDGSDLVILDASDFAGDPVARIKLPTRVPYGFHGNWIAS